MLETYIKSIQKIHTRDISLATYPHENNQVIVHGELKDIRYVPVFDITGRIRDPGVVHHMRLFFLVAPDPLRIVSVEGDMPAVPMEACRETMDRSPLLRGVEIKPGFTRTVNEIMGGTRGCTHLCGLVKAMAQEMVHGWLTRKRQEKPILPTRLEDVKERRYLVNSCRIWKEDGPRMVELNRTIQKALAAQAGSGSQR